MKLLADKVALITGAGRAKGIGRATALRMAEQGARVVVTDLPPRGASSRHDSYLQVVRDIQAQGGVAIGLEMDVGDARQVASTLQEVVGQFGGIDILFNNAASPAGIGPFLDSRNEDWDTAFQVNVMGMVNTCRHVIPAMKARGGGVIVNNASILGIAGQPGFAAYTVTKHAVVGLTRSLAAEFGADNIRVNAICPGAIRTQLNDGLIEMAAQRQGMATEQARALMERMTALSRLGEPEEVADVVVFLASPLASFVSGSVLPVAGAMNSGV